jgi:hypothetical protein
MKLVGIVVIVLVYFWISVQCESTGAPVIFPDNFVGFLSISWK